MSRAKLRAELDLFVGEAGSWSVGWSVGKAVDEDEAPSGCHCVCEQVDLYLLASRARSLAAWLFG